RRRGGSHRRAECRRRRPPGGHPQGPQRCEVVVFPASLPVPLLPSGCWTRRTLSLLYPARCRPTRFVHRTASALALVATTLSNCHGPELLRRTVSGLYHQNTL